MFLTNKDGYFHNSPASQAFGHRLEFISSMGRAWVKLGLIVPVSTIVPGKQQVPGIVTECWKEQLRGGGAHLLSQHLGGRGRQISESEANLFYRVSPGQPGLHRETPVTNKQTNKQKQTNDSS
jgi:hypothetical protein